MKAYRRFVAVDDDKELEKVMARKKWPSLLGAKDLFDAIDRNYQYSGCDTFSPNAQ